MNKVNSYLVPTVIEKSSDGERAFDIYSRLLNERIIFLGEEVNEHTANIVVAQLLHLAQVDPEADVSLYINSPGGSVYDGLAIYDTMNFIKPDVATYGIGFIKLDVDNPADSQVLIPAHERDEIDWDMANRLATENRDFLE